MQKPDDFVLSTPHEYAVYLPALNVIYNKIFEIEIDSSRPIPQDFELADLAFWSGKSKLWNHKYLLHSVGNYAVGTNPRGAIFKRNINDFFILGDCGGFQIGKGTLKGVKGLTRGISGAAAVAAWGQNYDAKIWIIDTLEQYFDYAMTIDMPLWAMTQAGVDSPFNKCTEEQLLGMTLENLELIRENKQGRTKWLNVIQGTTPESIVRWWDAVKHFRDGGWSLAGAAGWRGGIANVLATVLMMRDENAFDPGMDWVHVLGVSQPMWDIFLTSIQQQLRKSNPKLQISFDSATPFESGGARDQYVLSPALGTDASNWSMKFNTFPALRSHADSSNPTLTDLTSPIGKLFMRHHLVIDSSKFSGRRIDTLTNAVIVNHNIWTYLDAGRRANQLAFSGNRNQIPPNFLDVLDFIEYIFTAESWRTEIDNHRKILDSTSASQYY